MLPLQETMYQIIEQKYNERIIELQLMKATCKDNEVEYIESMISRYKKDLKNVRPITFLA